VGDPELTCSWVVNAEKPPPWYFSISRPEHQASVPGQLKRTRKRKLACTSLSPFEFPYFFLSLFL
jgi:hypothetical protein